MRTDTDPRTVSARRGARFSIVSGASVPDALRAAADIVADATFGNLYRSAMTVLLTWVIVSEMVAGGSAASPPLALIVLTGFYYLTLMIKSDMTRRSVIQRRIEPRRANVLRRLRGSPVAI